MMYPLVRDLAAAGAPIRVPVAVTCRVLKIARAPYYRWLAQPVTDAEWVQAHRANALFDAHHEDLEFGHRLLADEARLAGQAMSDRTAWRICSANGWWSVFGKPKPYAKAKKAGAPAHDDLVARDFTADAPNRLWLTDITEHPTAEGKLYLCAVKDVWSRRIVGYSIGDPVPSALAVDALEMAIARRGAGEVAGCVVHADRGSQGGFNWSSQHLVIREVFDGASSAGSRSGVAAEVAVTGSSEVPAPCGDVVLGADRQGSLTGGGCAGGRGVAAGRCTVVPQRWWHATVRPEVQAHRPLPVVRRA
jgi:transposase InsO family protein